MDRPEPIACRLLLSLLHYIYIYIFTYTRKELLIKMAHAICY